MAGLKDIRIRIASVRSTRKITSAMKVVSAAKFHKAQDARARFQRYREAYGLALSLAIAHSDSVTHPLMEARNADAPVVYVVFSSNASLCGAYNANVMSLAAQEIRQVPGRIIAFGKKAAESLVREGFEVEKGDEALVDRPSVHAITLVFQQLMDAFLAGECSQVRLVYNEFRNASLQIPVVQTLFPVMPVAGGAVDARFEYIFEPTAQDFFAKALPHYAELDLYAALMSSYVGEHGARMTAMTQATDNANNLIEDLTLEYNKARQAAITNEILEIVSGADALRSV